jgi:hypothetical protein
MGKDKGRGSMSDELGFHTIGSALSAHLIFCRFTMDKQ